ncbi:MAG: acyl-CoA dehydrogenase family protein, partial [Gaiella sp.]|uniref:acyl-CoA dehydrogenase family protein n=1 Tax=Gaiella sp. TaxID=2663207 RepID=UPI003C77365F
MDLSFTPLQEELRAQARGFLETNPEPTWAQLAELGWTGAAVPEERGGAGLTFLEEAVLHEESGRALLHAPFWSTSTLLPFLPADDQAAVAAGDASWTLALGPLVPDLDSATYVAVVGGDTIWELDGAEREILATSDESRPLGVLSGGAAGRTLCSSDVLPSLRTRSLAILALEAVGVAARALELSVAYVSDREQFGRRIGSYQAVSHPLASSLAEIELARSLAWWAAWNVAHDEPEAPVAAAAAKAEASDTAV